MARLAGAVVAATRAGRLFRTADRGDSWRAVDARGLEGGAVETLAATAGGQLFAGLEPAGLELSRDGGESWESVELFGALRAEENWLDYADRKAHVSTIAGDPAAPSRVYVGVEVGGAYRSDDAGGSWEPINSGLYEDVHELAVDPRDGTRLFAATGGGLFLSESRGAEWTPVRGDAGSAYCTALAVVPGVARGGSQVLVATTATAPGGWAGAPGGAGSRLHLSRDGGRSWAPYAMRIAGATREAFTALAPDPYEEEALFVATHGGHIYYGEEAGARWSRIAFGLGPVRCLEVA